ncbi:MAG: methionine--tRNA ligase [Desulfobacterales bacterium]|nr:methionine--tRNA ligase [Desulfobacterales bacterium]
MNKNVLVAAAWPYANGSLHLGHVSALLGADILARYHRLCNDNVLYVSGTDCHGTPIAIEAEKQKVRPSEIAERYHEEFCHTLIDDLGFSYDLYTTTTTENHEKVVQEFFLNLLGKGYIYAKVDDLLYCTHCDRFLPDRYVEGECPKCHYTEARGDQCDKCGILIDAKNLIKSHCKICGRQPELRTSEHFYLKLSAFRDDLAEWIKQSVGWRNNARNFSLGLLSQDIPDRAITRDTEWGIRIPVEGYEKKRIYVWFGAVIGYFSASIEWSKRHGDPNAWKRFWHNEHQDIIHYYVHGKDNIPFHAIIWPAILLGYGNLHLPDRIVSSEYLTFEKKQFSKSRNWAVWLPDFLANFEADTLRYYLTVNGPETADADFSWKDYKDKTNNELIATLGNFINRVLSLILRNFPEGVVLPEELSLEQNAFISLATEGYDQVGTAISNLQFRKGLKSIIRIAEHGNRYIDACAPWQSIKHDPKKTEGDLAVAGYVIYCLTTLLAPYLPSASLKLADSIEYKSNKWTPPVNKTIIVRKANPLFRKLDDKEIDAQLEHLNK